jgi:CheY-like chemotaxis protein
MTLLIVDDMDISRMLPRVAFEAEGHTTLEAAES